MRGSSRRDRSTLDDADRKLLAEVEQYGWHCLHVGDAGELPYWSFTVGVYETWQHAELVVFGLRDSVAHELLMQLVDRIREGESFDPGNDYDDILEGYRCQFVEVDRAWYSDFLGYAQWFYEAKGFPVLQLVLPDKVGRYPWDGGYAMSHELQPLLISPNEAATLSLPPPPLDWRDGDD